MLERPPPDGEESRASQAPGGANPAAAILAATAVLLAGAALLAHLTGDFGKVAAIEQAPEAPSVAALDPPVEMASVLNPPQAASRPDRPLATPALLPESEPVVAALAAADVAGFSPRLNPRRSAPMEPTVAVDAGRPSADRIAASALNDASSELLVLGQSFVAAEEVRPFFFADEIAEPAPPAPGPAVVYAGDIGDEPEMRRVILARGETFVDALRRAGVRAQDRNAAAAAFGRMYDLRRLRPGQELRLTTAAPAQTLFQIVAEGHEPEYHLIALEFKIDAENRLAFLRRADGGYDGRAVAVALTTRLASVSGRINGSLYNSAKRIGAPDKVVADLAAIFAYDVDFQREVFGGDEFEAVFEARYDENGRLVEAGDILYGRLKWKGRQKEKGYYRFASAEGDAKADYFDWDGESAKRLLMKTPIDGARLSSGFGARRHPISGYNRQHKGVDFAASRGTPIKAAGDGVVERADRYGGYGNYIRIRHGQGYKTAYGHMSGFAKGMRAGKRVEQGDVIGYVGSTGASTGPHLHYEVLHDNKHVNPQKLKVATGLSLSGADLKKFKAARDALDAQRRASADEERLATDEAAAKQL